MNKKEQVSEVVSELLHDMYEVLEKNEPTIGYAPLVAAMFVSAVTTAAALKAGPLRDSVLNDIKLHLEQLPSPVLAVVKRHLERIMFIANGGMKE